MRDHHLPESLIVEDRGTFADVFIIGNLGIQWLGLGANNNCLEMSHRPTLWCHQTWLAEKYTHYIYIYIYVYTHIYIYIYICIHIYIYRSVYIHTHTYIYICLFLGDFPTWKPQFRSWISTCHVWVPEGSHEWRHELVRTMSVTIRLQRWDNTLGYRRTTGIGDLRSSLFFSDFTYPSNMSILAAYSYTPW